MRKSQLRSPVNQVTAGVRLQQQARTKLNVQTLREVVSGCLQVEKLVLVSVYFNFILNISEFVMAYFKTLFIYNRYSSSIYD